MMICVSNNHFFLIGWYCYCFACFGASISTTTTTSFVNAYFTPTATNTRTPPTRAFLYPNHWNTQQNDRTIITPTLTKNYSTDSNCRTLHQRKHRLLCLSSSYNNNNDDGNENERLHPSGNPYADPNYPDLEFVNYDDPEYQVDQGLVDGEKLTITNNGEPTTEELVEEMREERRRRNDEYQFQTYYTDVLKNGQEFQGEWTVYKSTAFQDDGSIGIPRLERASFGSNGDVDGEPTFRVVSTAFKEFIETTSIHPTDAERIRHVETIYSSTMNSNEATMMTTTTTVSEQVDITNEIMKNQYWPDPLAALDFRGHQGIMVCGNAWTICSATPVEGYTSTTPNDPYKGPFTEYKTEVGIQENHVRLRLKFDYSVLEDEIAEYTASNSIVPAPALHLKSMTVCREALGTWPSDVAQPHRDGFFGSPGAEGGLYDPPPIKTSAQSAQYMLVQLDGRATVLFPFILDQDPTAHNGEGWVHSLDWQPTTMRYQVDRKVNGGSDLLGLRTLELSEVQGVDADTYRPRDGGQNMQQ